MNLAAHCLLTLFGILILLGLGIVIGNIVKKRFGKDDEDAPSE